MEKYRLAKIIAAASQLYVLTVNAATLTPSPTSPAEIDLPFTVKEGFILIQGSVDASHGVFMLDTGTPFAFFINRDLVPLPVGEGGASGSASSGQQIVMLKHGGNHIMRLAGAYAYTASNVRSGNLGLVGEGGASGSASSGQQIVMLKHGGNHIMRLAGAYAYTASNVRSGNLGFVGEELHIPLLGFLGVEWLQHYEFTLDYHRQVLKLAKFDGNGAMTHRTLTSPVGILPFSIDGSFTRLTLELNGIVLPAILDTGAQGSATLSSATRQQLERAGLLKRSKLGNEWKLALSSVRIGAEHLYLDGLRDNGEGADEITLGYAFLKHYRSVWNYRTMTVALFPR